MFENLLHQDAAGLLITAISNETLPSALLFVGPPASGKLTAALELARIVSCRASPAGQWQCLCPSCLAHKALSAHNLLLAGPRECVLEIKAASRTLCEGLSHTASWLLSSRYLFVRSVRKLLLRFSPILLEEDDRAAKIAVFSAEINELLEELDPQQQIAASDQTRALIDRICLLSQKLESLYMYDSLPLSHIRAASRWAHYTQSSGKKLIILEGAHRMQEGTRNALLKILEEPPAGVILVLCAESLGTVMPTLRSRLRPYYFVRRDEIMQKEVIERVFHAEPGEDSSIEQYLQGFLDLDPSFVQTAGSGFLQSVLASKPIFAEELAKKLHQFEPRLLVKIFCQGITMGLRQLQEEKIREGLLEHAREVELSSLILEAVRRFYTHITVYHQSPSSAIELLSHEISLAARVQSGGIII